MTDGGIASAILLDTCAILWMVNAGPLTQRAIDAIKHAELTDGVYVSTASAWEIGMLSRPRASRPAALQFRPDPKTWFARLKAMPGIQEALITADIAIDACYLPGDFHADPMDRLIVATARHLGLPVVTGDRKIIAYAAAGYVDVIPC